MSLSKEFAQMVQEQKDSISFIHPLLSGAEFCRLNQQENRCLTEYHHLLGWAESRGWQQIPNILEALHNPATAIVVTDPREKIEWVNSGFLRMTGYTSLEAIGRSPKFLQGKETDPQELSQIRSSIQQHQPFAGTLINYRKSGEAYHCNIRIFPLLNKNRELVNFIAIENEAIMESSWMGG